MGSQGKKGRLEKDERAKLRRRKKVAKEGGRGKEKITDKETEKTEQDD